MRPAPVTAPCNWLFGMVVISIPLTLPLVHLRTRIFIPAQTEIGVSSIYYVRSTVLYQQNIQVHGINRTGRAYLRGKYGPILLLLIIPRAIPPHPGVHLRLSQCFWELPSLPQARRAQSAAE